MWFGTQYDATDTAPDITEQLTDLSWEHYCTVHTGSGTTNPNPNISGTGKTPAKVSLKADIKQYPSFTGRLQDWVAFKRQFVAIASLHGHADVVNTDFVMPSDPEEQDEFLEKAKFIFAALTVCLAKGTAIFKVQQYSDDSDGHSAWKSLCDWYEGQGSSDSVAMRAVNTLSGIRLTHDTKNGVEGYISKFEEALQDLKETGHEWDDIMKKITFLSGVADPQYKNLVTTLRLDNTKTYEDCVMDLRKTSIDNADGNRNDRRFIYRRANFTTGGGRSGNRIVSEWMPSDLWTLLPEESKNIIREYRRNGRNGGTRRMNNGRGGNPPTRSQVHAAAVQNARRITARNGPTQNTRAARQVRNNEARINIVTARQLRACARFIARDENPTMAFRLLFDNCANVSLVGKGWRVIKYYPDSYVLSGFDENAPTKTVPMVDAVAVSTDNDGQVVLIGVARAAYCPWNSTSLISCYDVRASGWLLCDEPHEFGGQQTLCWPSELTGNGEDFFIYLQNFGKHVGLDIDEAVAPGTFVKLDAITENELKSYLRMTDIAWLNEIAREETYLAANERMINCLERTVVSNDEQSDDESPTPSEDTPLCQEELEDKEVDHWMDELAHNPNDQGEDSHDDWNIVGNREEQEVQWTESEGEIDYPDDISTESDDYLELVNASPNALHLPGDPGYGDAVRESWDPDYDTETDSRGTKSNRFRSPSYAQRSQGVEESSSSSGGDLPGPMGGPPRKKKESVSDYVDPLPNTRRMIAQLGRESVVQRQHNENKGNNDDESMQGDRGALDCDEKAKGHEILTAQKASTNIGIKPKASPQPFKGTKPKFSIDVILPRLGWLPLETIKKTLKNTTQLAPRMSQSVPLKRHFKSRYPQLNKPRIREPFATDTFFASEPAIGGKECVQLFVGLTSCFTAAYGMENEGQGSLALEDFIRDYGAPYHLRSDNSKMQLGNFFSAVCRRYNISQSWVEPHHQHQNPAERRIQDVKRQVNAIMDRTGAPDNLWLLCTLYVVYLLNRTSLESLSDKTPHEAMFGETPDISNLLQFQFFEPVYYYDPNVPYPASKEAMGHFVGIAENVGDVMTFYILTGDTGQVIARSTMRSAKNDDLPNNRIDPTELMMSHETTEETDQSEVVKSVNDMLLGGEAPLIDPDTLIGFSFVGKHRNTEMKKTIKEYDEDKNEFIIETVSGGLEKLPYQEAVDKFNARYDDEGKLWTYEEIIGHRYNKGRVELLVKWDTGEETWEPCKTMRKTDPLEVANYAHKNNLTGKKGWKWAKQQKGDMRRFIRLALGGTDYRYREILKTKAAIKSMPTAKYKFGIQVPKGVKHALQLDKVNGNKLWEEAIQKEVQGLLNFGTFEILKEGSKPPKGHAFIPMHACFDCKVDGRRKCRIVANGNMAPEPEEGNLYSGVVSIDSIRVLFLLGVMNGLQVISTDISQAYLHGITREKLYTKAGPEFGNDVQGRLMAIRRSVYGLVTSGAIFHEVLSDSLRRMGWTPSYADPNVWMRDAGNHYEYIATWVDDLLIFSKNPGEIIEGLEKKYTLKGTGVPDYYLGGNIDVVSWENSPTGKTFHLSARTYIKNICERIEKLYETELRHHASPMSQCYRPELDDTSLLAPLEITKYQMLVGCANWVITLGRFDVHYAIITLARYSQAPREGHLKAMLRVFGFLKHYRKWNVTVDPSELKLRGEFKEQNWKEIYPDMKEELPPNMPEAKGSPVHLTGYFDADHASDVVSRRSVTGILMFANSTPVKFYSRRQNTVETSTYGSEIMAARIAVDIAVEMRYKLRMLGVPVPGPALLYGDNQSVIFNTTIPKSVLKKKHNALAFHRAREACAAGIVTIAFIPSSRNVADALTKALGPTIFMRLVKPLFNWKGNFEPSEDTKEIDDPNSDEKEQGECQN